MLLKLLKSKIHRVTVTQSDLHYEGSISIDRSLMEAAGLLHHEAVNIWNVTNGERFETYVIPAARDSGEIGVNGAAARRVQTGDVLIIAAFCQVEAAAAAHHEPAVVFVDSKNRPTARRHASGGGPENAQTAGNPSGGDGIRP